MNTQRCAHCNVNWPMMAFPAGEIDCPACGKDTFLNGRSVADKTLVEARALREQRDAWTPTATIELPAVRPNTPHNHRVERYLELGFTEAESELLACAKTVDFTTNPKTGLVTRWPSPLHHLKVARALAAGLSHASAVSLYA